MILAGADKGRDNNFNLIRMIAASGVLVSHAYPIALGTGAQQPLKDATGFTLGWVCVAVFFAISGYLITRSFDRTSGLSNWCSARIARLFPGLIVVSVLIAAFYGPAFTTLQIGEYANQLRTYTYVLRNVTLVSLQYDLPSVFNDLPYPKAINGSLWTLVHEVACYGGVFLAGVFGALASRRFFLAIIVAYVTAFAVAGQPGIIEHIPAKLQSLRLLTFPFAIGMAFYVWRDRLRLSWLMLGTLAALSAVLRATAVFEPLFVLTIAYGTFVLAYRLDGAVRRYNSLGDYSYGMYVYAFPVQQAAVAIAGPMSPLENMALAFPVTLLFAICSWYWVEKPALDRRHLLTRWLSFGREPTAMTTSARNHAEPASRK